MATLEIFLVEDNDADIELTKMALEDCGLDHNLNIVKDGEEAIKYLKGEGEYEGRVLPELILLDLNLPKVSGKEVLTIIKKSPGIKDIPVIILSTSNSPSDVSDSYKLYANCYIVKPHDYSHFVKTMKQIEAFWIKTAVLPKKDAEE